jgi:hypothetical protein
MLLTPTFVGLLLAGAAFWTLIWAAIHKLDEIPYILSGHPKPANDGHLKTGQR